MRTLYFRPVVSSFFFRLHLISAVENLHVYDTFTHDVALVRIHNACLKCAAHGSLKIQDAKKRQKMASGHIVQLCRAISSHVSTIGKTC